MSQNSGVVTGNKKVVIDDHEFEWDPISAGRKFFYNSDVTVSVGVVSVTKNTGEHNPKKDAYRNCSVCGKHYNYHKHDHADEH